MYLQHLTVLRWPWSAQEIVREHRGLWARIPALSANLNSALGLTRETCQTRWKEKGEREGESLVDRVRERGVSYVSLCLCPLIPAGLDYPEFSTEQLRRGTWPSDLSEGRGGEVSGQVFSPQPPG